MAEMPCHRHYRQASYKKNITALVLVSWLLKRNPKSLAEGSTACPKLMMCQRGNNMSQEYNKPSFPFATLGIGYDVTLEMFQCVYRAILAFS